MLDDCKAVSRSVKRINKTKTPGHPLQAKAGEMKMCKEYGIMTEVCGAGSEPTCNGHFMTGRCERYDIVPERGYWQRINRFGRYIECRQGAVAGACTSGSTKACSEGKDGAAIFCNTSMKVNKKRGHCRYALQRHA